MNKKNILILLSLVLVAACSLSSSLDSTLERDVEAAVALSEKAKVPTKVAEDDTVRVKDDIWLGDSSEVEYEGDPLPSSLMASDAVTLVSSRPVTLFEIGDMVNKVTSVPVRFSTEIEDTTVSEGEANKPSVESLGASWAEPNKIIVSYKGSLSGLLDEVCSRFGLWWKYENKTIYFYKQITKTFVLYSLPSTTTLDASVGGSNSGEGGESSISLSANAEVKMWDGIEKSITAMVSSDTKVTIDSTNGTITLTATPTEIAKVAKFVNEQNIRMSRQVAISVKILQVTVTDSDNYGLDIRTAFAGNDTLLNSAGEVIMTEGMSAVGSAVQEITDAGNLSMYLINGDWTLSSVMTALSKQGTTSLVTSGTVTTLNNKPAPIQVVEKSTYISEYTKTESSDSGGVYDISVETEDLEVGFTVNLLPRILEHNRLLMLFNLTLSELIDLETVTFGPDSDGAYVQNPIVESRGFSQEVAMKSGETLVLAGYEKVEKETAKSGIGSAENSLFGGSVAASKKRNIIVILLTPVVLDSPLIPESRMSR